MYLKSLTLKGFKSFASSTTLKLEPGICAVVGPNGSGKSNVVDALAWVMGEQGAKTLRGGSMDDVIFAGAGDRKPLGRAEVTLTIDNSDGQLPIDYSEVSVTRRVFRDGGSEYEINGSKARLMDIQELLSDSGIGREMHVIVGQGRLASILESKPEDRRAFIEEAAGVLKHRRRKDKAQRKLVSMQTNLDRLQDLASELERQLKPLARQAEAAQKAATVQSEVREARLNLAAFDLISARENFEQLSARSAESAQIAETLEETAAEKERYRDELDEALTTLAPEAEAAQNVWFRLSSIAERINATGRIARERAQSTSSADTYHGTDPEELEAKAQLAKENEEELLEALEEATERLESIREDVEEKEEAASIAEQEHLSAVRAIADRKEGVTRLEAAQQSARDRLESSQDAKNRADQAIEALEPVIADAQQERAQAQVAVDSHSESLDGIEKRCADAEREVTSAEKRLKELRSTERDAEREISALQSKIETLQATARPASAARWISEHSPFATGALAALLKPNNGWESALSAALGAAAESLVVGGHSREELTSEITKLLEADQGRAWLIEEHSTADRGKANSTPWRLDIALPEGCEWLLDHVEIDQSVVDSVTSILVDVVAVPSVEVGLSLVSDDARVRAVTAQGVLMGAGWVAAGAGSSSAIEVQATIDEAQRDLARAQDQVREIAGTISGAEESAEQLREAAAAARVARSEYSAVARTLTDRLKNAETNLGRASAERKRAVDERSQAEARIDNIHNELDEIAARRSALERQGDTDVEEPSAAARDRAHEALTQVRAMEIEARMAVRVAEERASSVRGRADALLRQAQHEREARQRFEQAQQRRRDARKRAQHVMKWCEDIAGRVDASLVQATADRDGLQARTKEIDAQRSKARDELSAISAQVARAQRVAHEAALKKEAAAVRKEQTESRIVEQLGLNPDDLIANHDLTDFDRDAEQKRLSQAERALKSLGKVNPLALEEYKALEERYSFLSTQLMDVKKAREDLRDVIKDVDATILQLFTDAWTDVQKEFPTVFETLFPGGEGRLSLTDPDDMLTTGIEVHARPPGKRVTRLSLLSGGEKSLTALALLVSIFRARPSPFYVMDEVEAALDDVNLRRLIALFEQLRSDSQLIVITHQKPTMDIANVLYGVTMRGDGVTRVISQRMSPHVMPATEADVASSQPTSQSNP